MKVTGIIAEYNPFHNGHAYQINQIKNNGADYIIAIMSGDFVQRGEPAIIDKYARTRMALLNGVDLVIELPAVYALGDAKTFAKGAVSILDKLNVVNELSFGVEEKSIDSLYDFSNFLISNSSEYNKLLKDNLKSGLSYPIARTSALEAFFEPEELEKLCASNMILALEYISSLYELKSSIAPAPLKRVGANYNDTAVNEHGFSSASAIRSMLYNSASDDSLEGQLPAVCQNIISSSKIVTAEDFSSILRYKLNSETFFYKYLDLSESFSDRIRKFKNDYTDIDTFTRLLKSKNITHTSVQRLLMHIILNMVKDARDGSLYAHVLGFNRNSSPLLKEIKNNTSIPFITKLADADITKGLETDIQISNIYEGLKSDKYSCEYVNEFSKEIVIV